jgi:phycocyanobilin:ferredoxin oxidoreductase
LLQPIALDPQLASAVGSFKGVKIALEARGYAGGAIAFARFVEVWGGALEITNLLCLPRTSRALPIFGADFVSVSSQSAMFAADLSPVPGAPPVAALVHALPSAGELPGWCQGVFSPHPLFVRVAADRRDEACAAALERVDQFCALAAAEGPAGSEREILDAQREYARAHLEDDKGLDMLGRIFGDAWAQRFLREVMFPAPPAW